MDDPLLALFGTTVQMMLLSRQNHRSNTVQPVTNLFRTLKNLIKNSFLYSPNFLLNNLFFIYLLFKKKYQCILILFPLPWLLTDSVSLPTEVRILSLKNKVQKTMKHKQIVESVPCQPITPEHEACLRMRLLYPVSLHWRKHIFLLPTTINRK